MKSKKEKEKSEVKVLYFFFFRVVLKVVEGLKRRLPATDSHHFPTGRLPAYRLKKSRATGLPTHFFAGYRLPAYRLPGPKDRSLASSLTDRSSPSDLSASESLELRLTAWSIRIECTANKLHSFLFLID